MSGTFYVIGTPIGNLEDITLRQLDTLAAVDFICAEDTRVTLKLLNRFDIKKQLISFHEHSSKADAQRIIDRLLAGESCGIVTDAGMPCISDPGEVLVRLCAEQGIDIKVVPGPSAVVSAVAVSGLSTRRFTFEGFLPVPKKDRRRRLEALLGEERTMIFYEAPHKLRETLEDLCQAFGPERKISLCRELTKLHEEILRQTLGEAAAYYRENEPRGEYVLVVAGAEAKTETVSLEAAVARTRALIASGMRVKDAAKQAAEETGIPKNKLYAAVISEA